MKNLKSLLVVLTCSSFLLSSVPAWAHGPGGRGGWGHGGFGLFIGAPFPFFYPPYHYPPAYYYPPYYPSYPQTIVVPAQQQVYIQQETQPQVQQTTNYWYHCDNPEGYFPYIKDCPAGWVKVVPTPPSAQR